MPDSKVARYRSHYCISSRNRNLGYHYLLVGDIQRLLNRRQRIRVGRWHKLLHIANCGHESTDRAIAINKEFFDAWVINAWQSVYLCRLPIRPFRQQSVWVEIPTIYYSAQPRRVCVAQRIPTHVGLSVDARGYAKRITLGISSQP